MLNCYFNSFWHLISSEKHQEFGCQMAAQVWVPTPLICHESEYTIWMSALSSINKWLTPVLPHYDKRLGQIIQNTNNPTKNIKIH